MPLIGKSDLDVFPLTLGGNTFGWTSDELTSHAVLSAFVEEGGNFIDTSDNYSAWVPGHSGGESENIIGSWLSKTGQRDSVVVGTKVSQHPEFKGLSAANIHAAADASLSRLGVDHIDLYYAHYDDQSVPLAETAGAFNDLVTAGKIRYIGISNYSGARVAEWFATAEENGWALPVAVQPHYNLVRREPYESDIAPVAARYSLGVVPYFALASGFLTGKYRSSDDLAGVARAGMASGYLSDQALAVVDVVDAVARAHNTSLAAVAIAWLTTRPRVVAPIASARTLEQLPDLIESAAVRLTAAEIAALDASSTQVPAK
jgi:aryl-alcohol dehydrogenase-like predicted oxidoreductase